ncbi:MAG: type II toxin-antitoxin system VapC family toxin [Nitrospirae bacterium]|nr:type II toxin-antitoxin system VapC family toxin [Nitrospirota bacterium]
MTQSLAVIDASVAVQWFFTEADGERYAENAQTILHLILDDQLPAVVPTLFFSECANVLWKACEWRDYSKKAAVQALQSLYSLGLEVLDETILMEKALELSLRYHCPVYDCLYLAMALEVGGNLVTADEKFYKQFKASFPLIKWIGLF